MKGRRRTSEKGLNKTKTNNPPGGSVVKNPPANTGDLGSIPGSGGSPGGGNGNLLQYSCLENPMDRGDEWSTVHGVAKSQARVTKHTHNPPDKRVQSVSHLVVSNSL